MNEYVIHAKLKNNLILSRILDVSKNVSSFCAQYQLSQTVVGDLINLKIPALTKDGVWTKAAISLAEALGECPEDLFTEEQRTVRLTTNEAYIEMNRQQVLSMADPMQHLEHRQLVDDLMSRAKLTGREQDILRMRMAEDLTLEEIAEKHDFTRERVRQIEQKALRKLRNAAAPINSGIDQYAALAFDDAR